MLGSRSDPPPPFPANDGGQILAPPDNVALPPGGVVHKIDLTRPTSSICSQNDVAPPVRQPRAPPSGRNKSNLHKWAYK